MLTKFKSLKFKTKVAVGATMVAASIAAGGAAFAYIDGGAGTGSGSATGTSSLNTTVAQGALTVTVSSLSSTLTPGSATPSTFTITVTDNTNYSIHFTSAAVSISGTSPNTATFCGVTLATTSFAASGGYVATPATPVVLNDSASMADNTGTDTSGCQGASFPITATLS